MRSQQNRFDAFMHEFNEQRPHEALGMKTPASIYHSSNRELPKRLPEFSYPDDYGTRIVHESGRIRWPGRHLITLGASLARELVGCVQVQEDLWHVFLGPLLLGCIDNTRLDLGLIRTTN